MTMSLTTDDLPIGVDDLTWREYAKCNGSNHCEEEIEDIEEEDVWFPRKGSNAAKFAKRAKEICLGGDGSGPCPVLFQCREYALERNERFGIWGGLSEQERTRIRRARRRTERTRGRQIVRM